MPFPWKKAKCKRITQLVADHLHSPKRGGSLVVETGFPTSLIDLFVKNRDRLKKKPPKKKRSEAATADPIPTPAQPSTPPMVPPSYSGPVTPSSRLPPKSPVVLTRLQTSFSSGYLTPPRCSSDRFSNGNCVVGDAISEENSEVAEGNGVFMAILKIFLVVVLALGTKKFVVGITISTFLLIFMEYTGKHLSRLVKPCEEARKSFQRLMERVLRFVGIKDWVFKVPNVPGCSEKNMKDPIQKTQLVPPNCNVCCSDVIEECKTNDPVEEIQIVPPSPDSVSLPQEIGRLNDEFDDEFDQHRGKKKWVSEEKGENKVVEKEEAYSNDVPDVKRRRDKLGLKIKKFVKKVHCSKKKRLESKNEGSSGENGETSFSGDNSRISMGEEREHVEDGQLCGLEYDENSPSLSTREIGDQVKVEDTISSSGELSWAQTESGDIKENFESKTGRSNSGYLIFSVVLVGLVGGRFLAFALTLSWVLLSKSTRSLQKSIKSAIST